MTGRTQGPRRSPGRLLGPLLGRRLPAALGTVTVLLLGAIGCADGSSTEKGFDKWADGDPVPGATLEERSATNSIFGRNELFVTWKLTAEPSEKAVKAAMKGACSFETKSMPRYTLLVDTFTFEVACRPENQARVAAFWSDVKDLDLTDLEFTRTTVTINVASAKEAVADGVLQTVIAAATDDDLITDGNLTVTGQDRSSVSVALGSEPLTRELELVAGVFDNATGPVQRVTVIPGEVIASTEESVAAARRLEDAANDDGERLLVVGSAKTGWSRLPDSTAVRDLVDQVAARDDVTRVTVPVDSWDVETASVAASRDLLDSLASASATTLTALGPLDLESGQRTYGADAGGACQIRVTFPDVDTATTLLDVCASGAEVEKFADDAPRVTVDDTSLEPALTALHQLPKGTEVSITGDSQPDYLTVVVDQPLDITEGDDTPLAKQVTSIWKTLGPVG